MRHCKSTSLWSLGLALVVFVASDGCVPKPAANPPPQLLPFSESVGGIEKGSFALYHWNDGRKVLTYFDFGGASSAGDFKTGSMECIAKHSFSLQGGRIVKWRLEQRSGEKVKFNLADKDFDLEKGTLFLVRTKGGETEIEQLNTDLSDVGIDHESLKSFAQKNPAISKLIGLGDE